MIGRKYPITPFPKPRMTQRDRWKKRPVVGRYNVFKDLVKLHQVEFRNGDSICFQVPMPVSWSSRKKEAMNGKPHQQKPDLDNLMKALMDALFLDDSHIHHIGSVKKVWDYQGSITINNFKTGG